MSEATDSNGSMSLLMVRKGYGCKIEYPSLSASLEDHSTVVSHSTPHDLAKTCIRISAAAIESRIVRINILTIMNLFRKMKKRIRADRENFVFQF
jgi:hypothetical protein